MDQQNNISENFTMAYVSAVEFSELLIEEVKKYSCLYNPWDKNYKDNDVRRNVWISISHKLQASGTECRNKWKALRDTYVRNNCRKQLSVQRSKRPWVHDAAMAFLNPYIRTKRVTSNIDECADESVELKFDPNSIIEVIHDDSPYQSDPSASASCTQASDTSSRADSPIASPPPVKRRKTDRVEEAILTLLQAEAAPKDEVHHLLEYVGCILRSLDVERRRLASKQILDIVLNAKE